MFYELIYGKHAVSPDPHENAKRIPANLIESAKFTNHLFYDAVNRSDKLTKIVNMIEMDSFSEEYSRKAVEINFRRFNL